MKDQYFGDVNDYRKYGLLRALSGAGIGQVLVGWMMTPDDQGTDGKKRAYLSQPDKWRGYDPALFDTLAARLGGPSPEPPNVGMIEQSGLLGPAVFYPAVVPDGARQRGEWFANLVVWARAADLVFLDPDNGLEVSSSPLGKKGSSKYLGWTEVDRLWDTGSSMLIYQHFPREDREAFSRRRIAELRRRTEAPLVEALRTPHVLFLLVGQQDHQQALEAGLDELTRRWGDQFQRMGPQDV